MRHLITSALPYINGVKHLGNLVGSMLPADVFARFMRQEGHEVLYICATDEHGAPAEIAAMEANVPVEQFCNEQHLIQADIYERFAISFDHFGRSSSPQNAALTQRIATDLLENGHLDCQTTRQLYSLEDNRFLPDRYIIGTCPHCGYEFARGDQCEHCTRLLEPSELGNPHSSISGSTALEVRESKHFYLKLSALEPLIREWVESQQDGWPALTRQVARKWLGEGLQDRCITRDLTWGVKVPFKESEDKVFYVWFDAPIEYVGATWEWAIKQGDPEGWQHWWLKPDEVRYTQFMGKDNLPFHTIMFPSMLLASGCGWKLPDQIKGFHWLNYYGGKFSTSLKRGVFTNDALELYPADYWRYFLMSQIPESSDGTFTWELFTQTVNKDLADVLGNFANRVLKFCESKFEAIIPAGGAPGHDEDKLRDECSTQVTQYQNAMSGVAFREAMRALRKLWTLGNQYINDKAPWTQLKDGDQAGAALTIRTCLNLLRLFAVASSPIIPNLSSQLFNALGLSEVERCGTVMDHLELDILPVGRPIQVIPPLITRIDEAEIKVLEERFGASNKTNS